MSKVLVIDDRVLEKVGKFKELLEANGFEILIARCLEQANELFSKNSNDIDTVILDFNFPTVEEEIGNDNKYCDNKGNPNGVVFLKENMMVLKTKMIPVIINTCAENKEREEYLKKLNVSEIKTIETDTGRPLSAVASDGSISINRYLDFVKEGHKTREAMRQAPVNTRAKSGGPFIKDSKGNIIGYR